MSSTINFSAPQVEVTNGDSGIQISRVIIPYTIRDDKETKHYLGGQEVLTQENDNLEINNTTEEWEALALAHLQETIAGISLEVPAQATEATPDTPAS